MEKLNNNELDQWNARADANNREAFIQVFGREPLDVQEVDDWISNLLAECPLKAIRTEDEHAFIDGKAHITRWLHYE